LDTPPDDHNCPIYKAMSSYRIRIEQRIADIKDWGACKQPLRIPLAQKETLQTHHKHWHIVAALLNEQKLSSSTVMAIIP
jgi:hypothetical protein